MSLRATMALQGSRRFPLSSKEGNKDFYKGYGNHPGLGRKATGVRRSKQSRETYHIRPSMIRRFVVPDSLATTEMKPYVALTEKSSQDSIDPPTTPAGWPMADTKPEASRSSLRGGIFGPKGMDGAYYLQLARYNSLRLNQSDLATSASRGVLGHLRDSVSGLLRPKKSA
ncbi:uncharacterized protein L969DRAFT_424096 [Mixia osmundae IAM 14324]|uniref:Uncharacterized protein n=1 Tax=Mixia osmundae (strain CBS 9802 / IAM 14324 / JCM 22182 / KY 12970) TaxID=764103 RepID=G7E6I0_MIXOS|nr:uncharacterized protein L969DRAFT_424096 [Mixia osmundae IAM 14324]KEI40403.1 hypothetical protein L969DRAFT_424096 [Mixia osmundae IAM 14324]GAA98440.1 hypothetical protein E5Q_05126 [Mixia osmundae IAM 14324]